MKIDLQKNPPDSNNPIVKAIVAVVASAILLGVTYKIPEKVCPCTGWKWAFAIAGILAIIFMVLWAWKKWEEE